MSRHEFNAAGAIVSIYALGIFITWYPAVALKIPLPADPVLNAALNALWQTIATIVMPYIWAVQRLGFSLADLGLSTRNLGKSIALGCLLYSLALTAFIHCSSDL
jgi:hypothetical protein